MPFWSTGYREEEMPVVSAGIGRRKSRRDLKLLDRPTCNVGDVTAINSDISQLAVGKTAELVNCLPVAAPVAIVADQIHFHTVILTFCYSR